MLIKKRRIMSGKMFLLTLDHKSIISGHLFNFEQTSNPPFRLQLSILLVTLFTFDGVIKITFQARGGGCITKSQADICHFETLAYIKTSKFFSTHSESKPIEKYENCIFF